MRVSVDWLRREKGAKNFSTFIVFQKSSSFQGCWISDFSLFTSRDNTKLRQRKGRKGNSQIKHFHNFIVFNMLLTYFQISASTQLWAALSFPLCFVVQYYTKMSTKNSIHYARQMYHVYFIALWFRPYTLGHCYNYYKQTCDWGTCMKNRYNFWLD